MQTTFAKHTISRLSSVLLFARREECIELSRGASVETRKNLLHFEASFHIKRRKKESLLLLLEEMINTPESDYPAIKERAFHFLRKEGCQELYSIVMDEHELPNIRGQAAKIWVLFQNDVDVDFHSSILLSGSPFVRLGCLLAFFERKDKKNVRLYLQDENEKVREEAIDLFEEMD